VNFAARSFSTATVDFTFWPLVVRFRVLHVEDFAKQYGTKTNEELLRLARDLEHLTPEASVALTGKLAKRGVDGAEGMNAFRRERTRQL
jgi:hypothetical protein